MYAWLADNIIAHRRLILALFAALTLVFVVLLPRLQFNFAPQQMFKSTSESNEAREAFAERYGREDNLVTIAVEGADVFEPAVVETLRRVTVELSALDSIRNAESVATIAIPRPGDQPGTLATEPLLAQPTAGQQLPAVTAEQAEQLRELAMGEPLVRGRLVGDEADLALVVAWIVNDYQSADELGAAVDAVEATLADYPLPEGYRYRVSGVPKLRTEIVDELRTEQLTFVPLTGLIYVLILMWIFRRTSGVLLPIGVVTFAVLATTTLLIVTGSAINIVNNVLPSLIFVIGIADSIHMLTRDAEEIEAGKGRLESVKAMVRHTGAACLLTSATTAVGFVSLLAADTDILQRFGWQAAAGVAFAYVATLFFLPAALSYLRPVKRRQTTETRVEDAPLLERSLLVTGRAVLRHSKLAIVVSLAVAGAFGYAASKVEIDTTLLEVFHEEHPMNQTARLIEERAGGFLPIELDLHADEDGRFQDPAAYAKLRELQAFAAEQPGVLSTESVVDFHQATRAALLGDPAERDEMPTSAAQVQQLHLLIAPGPDEKTGVNQFVTADFQHARVLVRVADVGAKRAIAIGDELKAKLDELFPPESGVDHQLLGDAYIASVALDSFIHDLFYSLLLALVIIFGMMTVVFRSLKVGLISMLPNTIPLIMTFGYMGLMGINLNTTTIIIFAISLGIAVDDTIHFLARFREEIDRADSVREAILNTYFGAGRAILLTSVLLVIGLSVVTLSDFLPTRQFGVLTSITIAGAVLGDLFLLPPLLFLVYRKRPDQAKRLAEVD